MSYASACSATFLNYILLTGHNMISASGPQIEPFKAILPLQYIRLLAQVCGLRVRLL